MAGSMRLWLRGQLAEDVLGLSAEELDAQAKDAFDHTRVDIQHGNGEAAELFVSGRI